MIKNKRNLEDVRIKALDGTELPYDYQQSVNRQMQNVNWRGIGNTIAKYEPISKFISSLNKQDMKNANDLAFLASSVTSPGRIANAIIDPSVGGYNNNQMNANINDLVNYYNAVGRRQEDIINRNSFIRKLLTIAYPEAYSLLYNNVNKQKKKSNNNQPKYNSLKNPNMNIVLPNDNIPVPRNKFDKR